ncbi:hypothetical protein, partial [Bacillus altitudinis]
GLWRLFWRLLRWLRWRFCRRIRIACCTVHFVNHHRCKLDLL